jgi:hypothetical protein
MTGPPAPRSEFQPAPPIKRANPDGIPVRLFDGALVAHADADLADRLVQSESHATTRFERLPSSFKVGSTG